jgi:DnaJ homolog subfamily C member 7
LSFYPIDRKNLGNEYYKGKDYFSAIDAYSRAIVLDPTAPLLLTNRAAAYLMLQKYKETISDCDKALQLDTSCSKAYFRKATALRNLGNLSDAIIMVEKGLEYDATNAIGKQELKSLKSLQSKLSDLDRYLQTFQYTQALVVIEQLTKELGNNHREMNIKKAECLMKLRRLEEALNLTNIMVKSLYYYFIYS